ncbi:MAG: hypothetical protein IKV80_05700 [Bacteroidales bacterium]|nr:hypothetical protein [Bacteroidales bacterium]
MDVQSNNFWRHKWGIPIAHACLWIIGMFVTTDFLGIVDNWFPDEYKKIAFSLGTVIVIFFGEIIFTFIDVVAEQKIKILNIRFCYYVSLLIATIIVVVLLMFLGCHFQSSGNTKLLGDIVIGLLILVSTFTKGMEVWLQNNWDRFTIDIPLRTPILNFPS